MDKNKILNSITVVELASVLAGPSAGVFFAELGARVIKVENLLTKGDVTRKWKLPSEDADDDISGYFSCVNWGKKSIGINLNEKEGLEIIYNLVQKSDIIISNYKPGDAEKLKVDYKTLKKYNPKLIYAHITGYGMDKPWAGYDAIIQAETGFTYMNGEPDSTPTKMPVALMDILAAHQLKQGILLALLHRTKTGEGSFVQASLFESGIASLANQASNWLVGGKIPERMGSDHPNIAPYGTVFKTRDNKEIILAIGNDKQFNKLMEILDSKKITQETKFSSNFERVKNKEELKSILLKLIKAWDRDELLTVLRENDIPAGAVNNLKEVFETDLAKKMMLEGKTSEGKNIKGVKTVSFYFEDEISNGNISPPSHFCEDTASILKELLGFDENKTDDLRNRNVIG